MVDAKTASKLKNRKKAAQKAVRSSGRKRVFNLRRKTAMKAAVKKVKAGSIEELSTAYQAIDKAVKTGVIKKNTAARMKSRLTKRAVQK